jgi:hypothetical protein
MNLNNTNKNYALWKFFPLLIFIFNPKIDIISIPNYWQGIRLDDLIILFYSIYFFISNKFKIYPNLINKEIFGYKFILFFPYIIFSMFIGKLYLLNPQWMIAIRYLEYIGLIIILNQLDPPKEKILLLFKIYILLNFLIVLLQYFEIFGGLTSRGNCAYHLDNLDAYCFDKDDITNICFFSCDLGFMKNYIVPGGFLNNRVPGITGGVWELSVNLSICIYALALLEKKLHKIIPYILLAVIMMLISQSRGVIFAFIAGSIFLTNDYKKIFNILVFSSIFIISIYFLNLFNLKQIINDRFFIDYIALIKIILGAFTGHLPLESTIIGSGLESMWQRAYSWGESISDLKKSNILTIFGSGGSLIYTESFIIRIITSFGIIGTLIVVYFGRNLPLFLIVFILVSGITIDILISFKIFVFFCLFLMILKNKKNKT